MSQMEVLAFLMINTESRFARRFGSPHRESKYTDEILQSSLSIQKA